MKRLIALLLTVFTLISVIPITVSAAEMPFKDVKESHWFYNAVKYTYDRGIFAANNAAGDQFAPNASMTRAMFVTVLFRLSGVDQSTYTGKTVFTDVPQNQWYAKAVQWANEKGYVAGMTANTFNPNGKITRAQMARILCLYAADQDGYDLGDVRESAFEKFADKAKVQDWAKEGITWMSTKGFISGMGNENGAPVLNPNGTATRAQAAQILMGYMEYHNGEYPVGSLTLGNTDLSEFSIVYGETALNPGKNDPGKCLEIADFL
ncbi:MAG: S-layer homology domain-containing protein, partial [Clostridia bacterium]|nr:S-layer homology domain-containing protein [Clostridia bacterium]